MAIERPRIPRFKFWPEHDRALIIDLAWWTENHCRILDWARENECSFKSYDESGWCLLFEDQSHLTMFRMVWDG